MSRKVTVMFRIGDAGWSESHYISGSGIEGAATVAKEQAAARAKILGYDVTITRCRVTDTTNPKLTRLIKLGIAGAADDGAGTAGSAAASDSPYLCAIVPMQTAAGTRRVLTLSGFPDNWAKRYGGVEGDSYVVQPAALTKVVAYTAFLEKAPSLEIKQRKAVDQWAKKNVSAITTHTDGRYKITYEGGAALAGGMKVAITAAKGVSLGNTRGVRKVVEVISPTVFTIDRGPRTDEPAPSVLPGAKVQRLDPDYQPGSYTKEGIAISSRERGRGFSPRRGRRSASR